MRVRWRKKAAADLEEAAEYIAADNPTAAIRVASSTAPARGPTRHADKIFLDSSVIIS